MPVVPRYSSPQVATRALPGVRVNPNAPASAFDVPSAPDLSGATRVVARIAAEEKQKADQVAGLEADNQLAKLETDLRVQALQRKGKDALGATEDVTGEWQKRVSEIEGSLANDTQRDFLERRAAQRYQSLYGTLERHAAIEHQAYDEQQTKSALDNRLSDAVENYADPAKVSRALAEARAIVADYGRRNGLPEETRKQQSEAVVSGIHTGVIDRMLANGDDLSARQYYDQVKAEISGTDTTRLEQSLEEGSVRGESQRQADRIMGLGLTRADALVEARKISDPDVQDMTVSRVNQRYSEMRAAEQEQRESLYLDATNRIDQAPGQRPRDVIPPSEWHSLTLGQRNALERRATEPTTNDDRAWLDFLSLDQESIAGLTRSEFEAKYWSRFDASHRGRAESLWLSTREAAENPGVVSPKLSSTLTFNQRVQNTMQQSGVIRANKTPSELSKEEAKTAALFETEAAKRVEAFELTELQGKRKATGEEVQQILDDMALRRVFVSKFGRDEEKPTFLIADEERGRAYVPYDDVPIGERNDLEARYEAAHPGKSAPEDLIEQAYGAVVLGDVARARELLGLQ